MVAVTHEPIEPRWEDVRLFLALYRKRSLANAAVVVGLDPSTLSRRLAALEESIGTRLFDRTREGMVPTHDAELLLPAAEEMAAAHARFARDSSAVERMAEGVVRLSVPPGLAELFLPRAAARLHAEYPRIQLEVDTTMRYVDLSRREADLAIRGQRPRASELVSAKLGQRPWSPMTTVEKARELGQVSDWNALSWVAWGDDLQSLAPAKWLDKYVAASSVVLRTSHFALHISAVQAGVGAALLPHNFAGSAGLASIEHAPDLAPSIEELPESETWLVGHRALRSVPRIAAVWDALVEEFKRFEQEEPAAVSAPPNSSTHSVGQGGY